MTYKVFIKPNCITFSVPSLIFNNFNVRLMDGRKQYNKKILKSVTR